MPENNQLARRDDAQLAVQKPLFDLLKKRQKQIEAIIPSFLTPERVLNLVNTAILKTPDLVQCSAHSIVNAIMHACTLGLEIAPEQAYLIPFRAKGGKMHAQLLIDYRGKRDIVVAAGLVKNIHPYTVYSRDKFSMHLDLERGEMSVTFEPFLGQRTDKGELLPIEDEAQRGVPIGVLSIATMVAGGADVMWMPKHEIMAIKDRSRSKDNGPWASPQGTVSQDELQMWLKTGIHRHCKSLPKPRNPEAVQRVTKSQDVDDRYEMGEPLEDLITADFEDEQPMITQGSHEDQEAVAQRRIQEIRDQQKGGQASSSERQTTAVPEAGKEAGASSAPASDRDLTEEENRRFDDQLAREEQQQQPQQGRAARSFRPGK